MFMDRGKLFPAALSIVLGSLLVQPGGDAAGLRSGACTVTLSDGRALITGGAGRGGALADVEIVSPDGSRETAAPMAMPRSRHACAALADGRALVAGGVTTGGGATNAAEIYDPTTNSWTATKAMGAARSGHSATLLDDGRVLITQGFGSGAATLETFDPAASAFVPEQSAAATPYPRTISFSGHTWSVKTSSGRVGPGPNYFSDSTNNVWVDAQGQLHLKITKSGARWYCAEVVSTQSFGFGTYRFYLNSPVDALDPSVVLGLFTWDDAPDYNHREIDIEMSRWGVVKNQNAQYVVQPYNQSGNLFRWQEPAGLPQSTHTFQWLPASVLFQSFKGINTDPAQSIQQFNYTQGPSVPQAGGENARMNLWLYQGRAPTNKQPVEIVVNKFEFVPAP